MGRKTKYGNEAFEIHSQGSSCQPLLPFVTSREGAVGLDLQGHAALSGRELWAAGFPPVILGCLLSPMSAQSKRIKLALGLRGRESGAVGSLRTGGTPLCVSVPSGWPWLVCPADAYPHPHHRVCSQPDDGLQPTLQLEPKAVSTRYSPLL